MKRFSSAKILCTAFLAVILVSTASGFGYDAGEPLPNVSQLEVYDVTGLSTTDKRASGQLIHTGLNETVIINQTEQRTYRFTFEVANRGASTWYLNSSDTMIHEPVEDAWNLDDVYYNITSNLFFGGNLSQNTLNWDTGQQGSLGVGEKLYAEYIIQIPHIQKNTSQEFLVNDSDSFSGSRDLHRLKINRLGQLNVTMHEPPNNTVYQVNRTFEMNATVECLGGKCGDVNATPRYNETGSRAVMPSTESSPFYITDYASSGCSNMSSGEKCRMLWAVNATGSEGSRYTIDVNSSSTYSEVEEENSSKNLIGLNSFILMGLEWETIDFGYIDPGEQDQMSKCTDYSNCSYDVVIENYSVPVDNLWVKGTDLVSQEDSGYGIGISNMSYGLTNDISTEKPVENTYTKVASDLSPGTVLSTFYWLDVPTGIITGQYTGQITFKANNSG